MEYGFTTAAYVVAAILFILSLGGLSGQESAKRAIWYGIVGMALAVVATLFGPGSGNWLLSVIMIAAGGAIGWVVAKRVQMTEMPQLVAAMHSLVGLAAVFVGFNAQLEMGRVMRALRDGTTEQFRGFAAVLTHKTPAELNMLQIEVFLGVFIGAVTFTGSIVAFGKLAGRISGTPKKLPGGHFLNAAAAAASLVLGLLYCADIGPGVFWLVLIMLLAFFIGYHLIMGIGG
ncbi:NAD(P)(+) transhydrogenase (Re/Si-specific) subunit beta, partial [uncultured Paracoccus sp.]|uniref:NAD(P)(+) transhydrogenase (Re/Si-specific) subunit beta n=2 Tax=uncultured Paracoccus sp. TaxID=189685 RepID=UPI0026165157